MIVFTEHAKDKLMKEIRKLGITRQTVIEILRNHEMFFDALRNRFVAIRWSYKVAVIYEKTGDDFVVITVIYSSELKDIVNRRKGTGRWI